MPILSSSSLLRFSMFQMPSSDKHSTFQLLRELSCLIHGQIILPLTTRVIGFQFLYLRLESLIF